jgi:hypothetical protein
MGHPAEVVESGALKLQISGAGGELGRIRLN